MSEMVLDFPKTVEEQYEFERGDYDRYIVPLANCVKSYEDAKHRLWYQFGRIVDELMRERLWSQRYAIAYTTNLLRAAYESLGMAIPALRHVVDWLRVTRRIPEDEYRPSLPFSYHYRLASALPDRVAKLMPVDTVREVYKTALDKMEQLRDVNELDAQYDTAVGIVRDVLEDFVEEGKVTLDALVKLDERRAGDDDTQLVAFAQFSDGSVSTFEVLVPTELASDLERDETLDGNPTVLWEQIGQLLSESHITLRYVRNEHRVIVHRRW